MCWLSLLKETAVIPKAALHVFPPQCQSNIRRHFPLSNEVAIPSDIVVAIWRFDAAAPAHFVKHQCRGFMNQPKPRRLRAERIIDVFPIHEELGIQSTDLLYDRPFDQHRAS